MKLNFLYALSCASAIALVLLPATSAEAAPVGTGKYFKGPVGLQLYSLRAEFSKDVPGTLDLVKSFGIRYAELAGTYGQAPEKFRGELESRGIKAISAHYGLERYRDDVEGVAKEAKELGLEYVGCAWIPHEGEFSEKTCRETAEIFNRAGEALAKHGLKFFYHTHGYEFVKHGDGTLFDLLMSETNPKYVHFEMDIFWIVFPAQDPVKLLEQYPNRWALMHLKDMKKGLETGSLSGGTDVKNDVTLGTGQIDLPAVLKAAKKAGVKYYFIEDESPTSAGQIPDSLKFLESVAW